MPSNAVNLEGEITTGWYEINPATGETIGVTEDGGHQAISEYSLLIAVGTGIVIGSTASFLLKISGLTPAERLKLKADVSNALSGSHNFSISAILTVVGAFAAGGPGAGAVLLVILAIEGFGFESFTLFNFLLRVDPSTGDLTYNLQVPPVLPPSTGMVNVHKQASIGSGQVGGQLQTVATQTSGTSGVSWDAISTDQFQAQSINILGGTVHANGNTLGSGTVSLTAQSAIPVSISGSNRYSVNGTGSLSVYGAAESSLGVSGNWDNYTAAVTGNVTLTLTTDSLMLNGTLLPAGTYTITTTAATLSGSGLTTSPNFSSSVAITATSDTIDIGPGTGSAQVGGNPVDPAKGFTLGAYTGTITVSAGGGNNLDAVTLNGNAANALSVSATPDTLTTNQNTPIVFRCNINTSFTDNYALTAQAPTGWTVTIDANGKVTATPEPGLQGGSYPIQIIAQSSTDPNLVAQTTVNVTITPTVAGIIFAVQPDPEFTVPYHGAQVPTAFQAEIHNTGPAADTYNLNITGIPSGFTVASSATGVTVPAGQTGIVGIYLIPITGAVLPLPGTPLSFNVTATSTTNPAITKSATETFVMPTIYAVTIASNPVQVSASPGGAPATAMVTLKNVGNVAASAALNFTTFDGLTLSGLPATPIALAIGQTVNETVDLTPGAAVPLNTTLQAEVNVGPAVTQDVVSVLSVSPSVANPTVGQTVDVSADIFAGTLTPRQAKVSYIVKNGQGTTVFTSTPVAISLNALATTTTVDLGTFTAGSTAGQYTIDVVVDELGGQAIAGAGNSCTVYVGSPLNAELTLSTDTLSPDRSNSLTNALTLTSAASDQLAVTATVVVPNAVTADSFSTPPTHIVAGANSETLTWNVTLAAGGSQEITWQSTVNNLQPGQVQPVVSAATVQYTDQSVNYEIMLPALTVGEVPMTQSVTIPVAGGLGAGARAVAGGHCRERSRKQQQRRPTGPDSDGIGIFHRSVADHTDRRHGARRCAVRAAQREHPADRQRRPESDGASNSAADAPERRERRQCQQLARRPAYLLQQPDQYPDGRGDRAVHHQHDAGRSRSGLGPEPGLPGAAHQRRPRRGDRDAERRERAHRRLGPVRADAGDPGRRCDADGEPDADADAGGRRRVRAGGDGGGLGGAADDHGGRDDPRGRCRRHQRDGQPAAGQPGRARGGDGPGLQCGQRGPQRRGSARNPRFVRPRAEHAAAGAGDPDDGRRRSVGEPGAGADDRAGRRRVHRGGHAADPGRRSVARPGGGDDLQRRPGDPVFGHGRSEHRAAGNFDRHDDHHVR